MYFEWTEQDELESYIKAVVKDMPCEPIVVIGHSYGGDMATDAAMEGGVDLLITIDPVSWDKTDDVNTKVGTWVNVGSNPSESNGFAGDRWAFWGGQWDNWPSGLADQHARSPYHHNEFREMMRWRHLGLAPSAEEWLKRPIKKCGCEQ